jgi:hypothetical protein
MENQMTIKIIKLAGGQATVGDVEGVEAALAAMAAENGRQCGNCSQCCKVLDIPGIPKPAGSWCKACQPGRGCTIYDNRPEVCRAFACGWLVDGSFGDEWRADPQSHGAADGAKDGYLVLYIKPPPRQAIRRSPPDPSQPRGHEDHQQGT